MKWGEGGNVGGRQEREQGVLQHTSELLWLVALTFSRMRLWFTHTDSLRPLSIASSLPELNTQTVTLEY